MEISPEIIKTFCPNGHLRASINIGNPILAGKDPKTGLPFGVSIDLANHFAKTLGVDIELVVFASARESVEALSNQQADIGFFAIDPLRGQDVLFTAPYVLIEGSYLVKNESSLQSNDQVDQAGHRVVVGQGSAYDLYLTRELKAAQIIRATTSPTVIDVFMEGNYEVAAGVKQQLEANIRRIEGLRLLPGRFMVIQQAMGLPKSYGKEAALVLTQYVERMKATGFVADAMLKHQIQGASVAPLTS
jgi:polar amino acid transport system substrate-binding protein